MCLETAGMPTVRVVEMRASYLTETGNEDTPVAVLLEAKRCPAAEPKGILIQ
jgi:hypothetical protein